jgi:hypothetical protein
VKCWERKMGMIGKMRGDRKRNEKGKRGRKEGRK